MNFVFSYLRTLLLFSFAAFLGACSSSSSCDYSVENYFNTKIKSVENGYIDLRPLPTGSTEAVYFLEQLTGIQSSVIWGDVSAYENQTVLKSDIDKWQSWLKENCSNLTISEMEFTQVKIEQIIYRGE